MKDKKIGSPRIQFARFKFSYKFPKFWSFRIPIGGGIYMGGGKLIIASLSTVALGFVASIFLLISSGDQQIIFPDLGASYVAPDMVGTRLVDEEFPDQISQTLQINMPAGIRLDEVTLTNISLGKAGLTDAFQILGTSTVARIVIDELTIKNSEFPTMDWANGEIYSIVVATSTIADGHTFSPTMATGTKVTIGSGRGSTSYIAEDMVVDRILLLQSSTGGDVLIDKLTLDGVRAFTGAFNADWFQIGTLRLENVRIGSDGNINTADLVINSSVTVNNFVDGTQEQPIMIR